MKTATTRIRTREWTSFHGHAVPMAHDSSESVGEFVRALHHRVCQPLTALSCALELIQTGREADTKLTDQIQSAIAQSERLMETMRLFRQLFEAESADREHHAVVLSEMLREVIDDLGPLAELQQVSIKLEVKDGRC